MRGSNDGCDSPRLLPEHPVPHCLPAQGAASNAQLFDDFGLSCTSAAFPNEANSDYISVSAPGRGAAGTGSVGQPWGQGVCDGMVPTTNE